VYKAGSVAEPFVALYAVNVCFAFLHPVHNLSDEP